MATTYTPRFFEEHFHITKLQLLEVAPLTPFLMPFDGLTCLDIGANTGLWAEAFLSMHGGRTDSYTAFEPMSGNQARFNARMPHLAAHSAAEITLVEACVGAAGGEVEINFDSETTTLASVSNAHSDIGHTKVALKHRKTVPQVSIDGYCREHGLNTVHLAKIDVEGYEFDVLKGAEALLCGGDLMNVYYEFGTHQMVQGQSFRQFFELLSDHGMQVYKSVRGKNYFGLNRINRYHRSLEPKETTVDMFLGSRLGPSEAYNGPRVVGKIN